MPNSGKAGMPLKLPGNKILRQPKSTMNPGSSLRYTPMNDPLLPMKGIHTEMFSSGMQTYQKFHSHRTKVKIPKISGPGCRNNGMKGCGSLQFRIMPTYLYDEIRHGVKFPDRIPKQIVERAWGSPHWYSPAAQ